MREDVCQHLCAEERVEGDFGAGEGGLSTRPSLRGWMSLSMEGLDWHRGYAGLVIANQVPFS